MALSLNEIGLSYRVATGSMNHPSPIVGHLCAGNCQRGDHQVMKSLVWQFGRLGHVPLERESHR